MFMACSTNSYEGLKLHCVICILKVNQCSTNSYEGLKPDSQYDIWGQVKGSTNSYEGLKHRIGRGGYIP